MAREHATQTLNQRAEVGWYTSVLPAEDEPAERCWDLISSSPRVSPCLSSATCSGVGRWRSVHAQRFHSQQLALSQADLTRKDSEQLLPRWPLRSFGIIECTRTWLILTFW